MPFARIWRCVKQNFAGSTINSALPPRVLQEKVLAIDEIYFNNIILR